MTERGEGHSVYPEQTPTPDAFHTSRPASQQQEGEHPSPPEIALTPGVEVRLTQDVEATMGESTTVLEETPAVSPVPTHPDTPSPVKHEHIFAPPPASTDHQSAAEASIAPPSLSPEEQAKREKLERRRAQDRDSKRRRRQANPELFKERERQKRRSEAGKRYMREYLREYLKTHPEAREKRRASSLVYYYRKKQQQSEHP